MATLVATRKLVKYLLLFLCFFGFLLCMYVFHVEISKERDSSYKAWCDLSQSMSCSKVFTSRYGKGFGLIDRILPEESIFNQPNSIFGMTFYTMQIFMTLSINDHAVAMQTVTALIANFGSLYLFYVLYFVLHDFCIVCISTYIVNALILVCAIHRLMNLHKSFVKKSK